MLFFSRINAVKKYRGNEIRVIVCCTGKLLCNKKYSKYLTVE